MNNLFSYFNGFRFESPYWLFLLIFLLIVFYLFSKKKKPSIKMPIGHLLKSDKRFSIINLSKYLYFISCALLIIALARPQFGVEEIIQKANGIDMMIAMDLSGSMQAIDYPPNATNTEIQREVQNGEIKPRIDFSRAEIMNFIKKRPDDRIGLVVFAPRAYVACPPTLDHTFLINQVSTVQPNMVGDSTNIAAPIVSAINRLKNAKAKRKVILFFTDGSNNVNDRITPIQAAKLAKTYNIIIYTVGLGSNNAFVLQDSPFGTQAVPIYGQFDEKLMKEMANLTGGEYFKASDAEGLKKVLKKIDSLEKTTVETPRFVNYSELAPRIIILSLIIILVGIILDTLIFVIIP